MRRILWFPIKYTVYAVKSSRARLESRRLLCCPERRRDVSVLPRANSASVGSSAKVEAAGSYDESLRRDTTLSRMLELARVEKDQGTATSEGACDDKPRRQSMGSEVGDKLKGGDGVRDGLDGGPA